MQCPCGGATKRRNWKSGPAEVCQACGRVHIVPMRDPVARVVLTHGVEADVAEVALAFQSLGRRQRNEVWRLMEEVSG